METQDAILLQIRAPLGSRKMNVHIRFHRVAFDTDLRKISATPLLIVSFINIFSVKLCIHLLFPLSAVRKSLRLGCEGTLRFSDHRKEFFIDKK